VRPVHALDPIYTWVATNGFEIWESSSLTWDSGTLVCSATLTDTTTDTVSCSSGTISPSTQYRVQYVLTNIGPGDSRIKGADNAAEHVETIGASNWAGTSPTLGTCEFEDFEGNNGNTICTLTASTTAARITNPGNGQVKIGKNGGTEGVMYLITTDSVVNTSSASYINVVDISESVTSSKITITAAAVSDTTAPSAVSDLAASGATTSSIDLTWTAPGDDDSTGTATSYDVRYSTATITEGNWGSATEASGEPTPSVSGTSESMTVSGLTADTTYFFAIKTSDEVPNESAISNVPSLATSATADTTAPDAISDLALSDASNSAITVSWTAPGDDGASGTATTYDLRYSTSVITSGNFSSATTVSGEPTPSVAGSNESKVVSGLSAETTYFFAIKTSDEVPNESGISNVPSLATTATPDTTAPSAVSDLAASGATASSIDLSWTASGDDGASGTATFYDVRYSTATITEGNWSSATQATGESTPSVAGTSEDLTVSGLTADTTYFFAIKTADEVPNESTISNVPSLATSAEDEEPEPEPTIQVSGGGATGGVAPSSVSFSGQAFPGSTIEVLRKSPIDEIYTNIPITNSSIGENGVFSLSHIGLLGADYLFALRFKDKDGRETGILSFGVNLLSGNLIAKDIFVPPTIGFLSSPVKKGKDVEIVGYAAPGNTVQLEVNNTSFGNTIADASGFWSYATTTSNLKIGEHYVRAQQIERDEETNEEKRRSHFSILRAFKVTTLSYPRADFNNDNEVNITDWSVFLFRWSSKEINLRDKIDLNNDGKIDIGDFSIFLRAIRI